MNCRKNISRKEALEVILNSLNRLEPIKLSLAEAMGHVLAEDIYAPQDIPSYDRAAMDGYAVSSRDTVSATADRPVRLLPVTGEVHPSTSEPAPIEKNQCVRIMTGGRVPTGADAVVKDEDVRHGGKVIAVGSPARQFQYVSKKGQDIKKGDVAVTAGSVLGPSCIGGLAALHVKEVLVTRRPEIALLAIGNELIGLDNDPDISKIVASNLYMVSAMMQSQGCEVGIAKITRNEEWAITRDLEKALTKDLIITFGGTSNGDSDLTISMIKNVGVSMAFAGVAMRPGKGTSFGLHNNSAVFALPGTPSAVLVACHTFVLPAIRRLAGLSSRATLIEAVLERDVKKQPGVEHLVQAFVIKEGPLCRAIPLTGPGLARLSATTEANALIMVPADKGFLAKGECVRVQLLDYGRPWFAARDVTLLWQKGQGRPPVPVISVVGKSDAGKTTFLERLVPELTARGYRVGTIKHDVHGFDIDHEGKDSWRHKHAGARTVAISSPKKIAIIKDVDEEETIDSLAARYFDDMDIILTEGYKRQDKPKIEIFRSAVHATMLCENDARLVAIVSDVPAVLTVPRFELGDVAGVADLLEQRFLSG